MQKILIVEDDIGQLDFLSNVINSSYPSWTICTATNFIDAKKLIDESVEIHDTFSLFLFDVQLSQTPNDRMGFELGKHLRDFPEYYSTPVLYLTSIPDEHLNALHDVHYYDYITKPYYKEDILNRLEQMLMRSILDNNSILITDINSISHKIIPKDILYVKSIAHTLEIYLKDYVVHTRNYNMSTIEPLVTPYLIRCHNRFYVNKKYIKNFDPVVRRIHIGKHLIDVSKSYVQIISEAIKKEG